MTMPELLNIDLGSAAAAVADRLAASVVEVRPLGWPGAGAGTIWRSDGIVMTNHHVAPGDEAEVHLLDGRRLRGRVIARDEPNDLAAIQIAATGLPAAPIGDARTLRVGELVLAVGHPFGL